MVKGNVNVNLWNIYGKESKKKTKKVIVEVEVENPLTYKTSNCVSEKSFGKKVTRLKW